MGPDGLPVSLKAAIKEYYAGFPGQDDKLISYIDNEAGRQQREAWTQRFEDIVSQGKSDGREINDIKDDLRAFVDQIIRIKNDFDKGTLASRAQQSKLSSGPEEKQFEHYWEQIDQEDALPDKFKNALTLAFERTYKFVEFYFNYDAEVRKPYEDEYARIKNSSESFLKKKRDIEVLMRRFVKNTEQLQPSRESLEVKEALEELRRPPPVGPIRLAEFEEEDDPFGFDLTYTAPAGIEAQNLQFQVIAKAEESANIGRQIAEEAIAQESQGALPQTLKNIQEQPYFEEAKKIKEEASRIRAEQAELIERLASERELRISQIGKENTELFEHIELERLKKEQEQRAQQEAEAALEESLNEELAKRAQQRAEDEKAKLLADEKAKLLAAEQAPKEPDRLFEYISNATAIATISKALIKNDDSGIAKYIAEILEVLQYYQDRGTDRLDIALKKQELLMIKAFIVSKYYELRKVPLIEANTFNEVKQLVDTMIRTLEEIVGDFKYNSILEVGNRINRRDNTVRREYMGPDPNKSDFLQRIDAISANRFGPWTTPVFPKPEPGTPEQRSPAVVPKKGKKGKK